MTNIEQQHEVVKDSLFSFVNSHISGADLTVVDDIIISYLISILEEASQDPCFDVEGFIEMMSAYFVEFSKINPATICAWIFQLEKQLNHITPKSEETSHLSFSSLSLSDIIPEVKLLGRPPSISECSEGVPTQMKRIQHLSETSDGGGSTDSSNCDFFSDECDVLQEMFAESSFLEVKHCITIANGDIDRATQILLDRQESGQSLSIVSGPIGPKCAAIDDNELKNRIIARYSYVDKNAASREYKPVVPKVEPKKLVRYRDNKIVSLRGEKFTDIKYDDDGEIKKPKKPICP